MWDLQRQFTARSWLDPTAKTDANGLAILALSRIITNVEDNSVIMQILSSVIGLERILKGLSCKSLLLVINVIIRVVRVRESV